MAAHGVEQAKRGARHVAVVTTAASGIGRVMGVRRDLRRHGLVTLQTCQIAIHLRFQLLALCPV